MTDSATIDRLRDLMNRGDRVEYYAQLTALGDPYGALAAGVVTGDLVSGRLANTFLAETAFADFGVQINPDLAQQISMGLMRADFEFRRDFGPHLNVDQIEEYHQLVFQEHGLDITSWTAYAPLKMAFDHPESVWLLNRTPIDTPLNWASFTPQQARAYVWEFMLSSDSADGSALRNWMAAVARNTGDPVAQQWVDDVDALLFDEAGYLATGEGTPYPPDGEPLERRPAETDNPQHCFVADTPIAMFDGTYKPIQDIRPGDVVVSFDKDGNKIPGTVSRTFQNEASIVLDFHGLGVTPGHSFYCGDGQFAGRYIPLIDILRLDATIRRADGDLYRANTKCKLGSEGDRAVQVVCAPRADGATAKATLRFGQRLILDDGKDTSIADLVAEAGGTLTTDGLIQPADGGPAEPFAWTFSTEPPKPEDYVLKRSGLTLEMIYDAGEWEAEIGPQLPSPIQPAPVPEVPAHVMAALQGDGTRRPTGMEQIYGMLGMSTEDAGWSAPGAEAPEPMKPKFMASAASEIAPNLPRKQRRAMAAKRRKAPAA